MATAAQLQVPIVEIIQPPIVEIKTRRKMSNPIRKMPIERFREWKPRDGYKYDWNNGIISIYKKMVTEKQRYIVINVSRAFTKTTAYTEGCDIIPESEMSYNDEEYRIPDMAFYTKAQTRAAAEGQRSISEFVIEILSDTDLQKNIENKLWEYFEQGVKCVWHILPYRQLVKVYTSPREVKILLGDDVCSAKPVLEDFEITVNQIFEL